MNDALLYEVMDVLDDMKTELKDAHYKMLMEGLSALRDKDRHDEQWSGFIRGRLSHAETAPRNTLIPSYPLSTILYRQQEMRYMNTRYPYGNTYLTSYSEPPIEEVD